MSDELDINSDYALVVFDLTSRPTYRNIPNWTRDIMRISEGIPLAFAGMLQSFVRSLLKNEETKSISKIGWSGARTLLFRGRKGCLTTKPAVKQITTSSNRFWILRDICSGASRFRNYFSRLTSASDPTMEFLPPPSNAYAFENAGEPLVFVDPSAFPPFVSEGCYDPSKKIVENSGWPTFSGNFSTQ